MQNLKNKPFQEVPGGEYDPYGFYYTPNGSFWDPDGIYFNSEGYDAHRGYYDDKLEYQPGPGWIPELLCYEDEKDGVLKQMKNNQYNAPMPHLAEIDDEDADEEGDIDDIYEEIDYDKLIREEEKKNNKNENMRLNDNTNDFFDENYASGKNNNNVKHIYNPKNVAESHIKNIKNFENDVKQVNEKYLKNENTENKLDIEEMNKTDKNNEKENIVITPEMLFNKIPENLKPKNLEEGNVTKIEKKIEVDSLFG